VRNANLSSLDPRGDRHRLLGETTDAASPGQPARERKSLDGLWRFRIDSDGRGRHEGWQRGPLVDARDMPVPASHKDVLVDSAARTHVSDVWY
jgi:beta-galactosidase/beta-glucuronidase